MFLPLNTPPESWKEEDLKKICDEKHPESQRLDYKRELKLITSEDTCELLKDVTALANSLGGVLIYGIEEEKDRNLGSVAGKLCPMQDINVIDRASRIINGCVSPGMKFYLHKITDSDSGFYLIINIPQSCIKPHAFHKKDRIRWYIRRHQNNFEMTEPEIREMYFQTLSSRETIESRYKNLDLDIGAVHFWSIVSIPFISGLNLIDTLNIKVEDIKKGSYSYVIRGGNGLKPSVDRFEADYKWKNEIMVMRLFPDGEFMFKQGFYPLEEEVVIGTIDVYRFLYNSLKYFGELYSNLKYFGYIRLCLETRNLSYENIKIVHKVKYDQNYNFERNITSIHKDIEVEKLNDPEKICNDLFTYFVQGFGGIVTPSIINECKSYLYI